MADPATYRPPTGTIPVDPGVYRFIDARDQVIYVGKAKSLRARLTNYFQDLANLHPRTQAMVTSAARVEWTVVRNELESLQLEYTWIKKYDPRFNIKYRDDKTYPWLAVTWSDEFPRVFVGRGAHRKGWRYFGPFGQAWAIRDTVDLLLRVFPMRSCSTGVFNAAGAAGRPCLLGYIGKCSAPCVGRISAEEHRAIAADFCSFMAGHSSALERRLTTQMKQAAINENFEQAAVLRDALEALKQASERNAIVLGDGANVDLIALALDPLEVAVQIFNVRSGRVAGERGWVADRTDDADEAGLVESFLLQLYSDAAAGDSNGIPPEILVPTRPDSADVMEELLEQARGAKVSIRVPQRGDKRALLDTVGRNAAQTLAQHKLKRAADLTHRSQALSEIQEALGLPEAPLRIECYDISHIQGTNVVGSMVVFEDGLPRKAEYRRFLIKSFEGSNDVAAMDEVLSRRFRRLLDDEASLHEAEQADDAGSGLIDPETGQARRFAYRPSLIVVDGGLPQVNAVQIVLERMGVTGIALCGLAKRLEEVWIPGEEYPVILPRSSEGLYLLQRVRDEAHRFAITFHRERRGKAMVESVLDDVPGLGEVRRKTVLAHYGSLAKLRKASLDDLTALPGIGEATAQALLDALAAHAPGQAVNTATGEVTTVGEDA